MKKHLLFLFLIILCSVFVIHCSFAQAPAWAWVKTAAGSSNDEALACTTDASGNVYVVGDFLSDSITFGSFKLKNSSSGFRDLFIVKYDAWGDVLWAKSEGGKDDEKAYSVITDASGNVYVAGCYRSDSIVFGSDTLINSSTMSNSGLSLDDMFLLKFNSSGTEIWAKTAGGSYWDDIYSVTADVFGHIYLAGYFESESIKMGAITKTNSTTCHGYGDMLIAKYDTTGNILWVKSMGGDRDDMPNSISTDASGNIYLTGYYRSSSITFGTYTLTNVSSGNNIYDMFLVKFDPDGIALWAQNIGGSRNDYAYSLNVDNSGNVYMAGSFNSPTMMIGSIVLNHVNNNDVFFAKFNSAGICLWAKSVGGNGDDIAYSVSTDASGNAYLAGTFNSFGIIFDEDTLYNTGAYDIFLVKYNSAGIVEWAKSAGGSNLDEAWYIASDAYGNLYLAGDFSSLKSGFDSTHIANSGGFDMFLAKIGMTCQDFIFTKQPISPPAQCGYASAIFTVEVSGNDYKSYQWQVNKGYWSDIKEGGSNPKYTGSSSSTLIVDSATSAHNYRCKVYHCGGYYSDSSQIVNLTIKSSPEIIFITAPEIKCSRDSMLIKIVLSPDTSEQSTIRYQWYKDGKEIIGATTSAILRGVLVSGDAGTYTSAVTNNCGSTLANTELIMGTIPIFNDPVSSMLKHEGDSLILSVLSGGTEPFTFQWLKNDTIISGATDYFYKINILALSDSGTYSSGITNICGSVTKRIAKLKVQKEVGIVKVQSVKFNVQFYPNPVNENTVISYKLSANCHVSLKIFDVMGREIEKIVDEENEKGQHAIKFDDEGLKEGLYFYRIVLGNEVVTGKIVIHK